MGKTEDGKMYTRGVRAPDGTYYKLEEGEEFIINKEEDGDYEAIAKGVDGEQRVLKESLSSQKVRLEQENQEVLAKAREKLGLKKEGTEDSMESRETRELSEKLKPAAEYLDRLDRYAEAVSVDPDSGKIHFEKPKLEDITDGKVKEYQKNFTELIREFKERNKAYIERLRSDPAILDVQEIAGAIVATYDSSKGTPRVGDFYESDKTERGGLEVTSEEHLGLAMVDINKDKRKDGVSPSTSAEHELNHYALSVSDYLISKDGNIDMQSAYRKGRTTALYGSGKDRITTGQALLHDKEQYSAALGREFDSQADGPRIEKQLSYLDELHSSFLQRKENWFNAQENVYSGHNKGKHWELVGDHPDDIEASKRMLGYMQGFYTMDKIKDAWQQKLDKGGQLGEGQKKFMKDCEEEFRRVGGLVGTARTVQQAEALVAEAWKSLLEKHQRVTQTADFQGMMDGWEKGAGVENLRGILLKEKTKEN